jgi:hypothetical protein
MESVISENHLPNHMLLMQDHTQIRIVVLTVLPILHTWEMGPEVKYDIVANRSQRPGSRLGLPSVAEA